LTVPIAGAASCIAFPDITYHFLPLESWPQKWGHF
jgi:hypothetical protein